MKDKIWNNIDLQHHVSISLMMQSYVEWCHARIGNRDHNRNHHQPASLTWHKPNEGYIKCNIDATLFKENNTFGVGICLRGHQGDYICPRTFHSKGVPNPRTAEAWGLLQAMKWISDLQLWKVIFEVDCKVVIDGISQGCRGLLYFRYIISKYKAYLSQFPNTLVSFAKRQAKHVAHSFARSSQFYASCHNVPSCISCIILNEMS